MALASTFAGGGGWGCAQEPISYTQRGTIAKGDLVLAPVELLPAEWRSWRGISTTLDYVRRAATMSSPSRSPKRGGAFGERLSGGS
jgi:hypothetical protein